MHAARLTQGRGGQRSREASTEGSAAVGEDGRNRSKEDFVTLKLATITD